MARGLAEAGAAGAIAYLAGDRARVVAEARTGGGGRAVGVEVDITSRESAERMVSAMVTGHILAVDRGTLAS